MIIGFKSESKRNLHTETRNVDFVVVGGGLTGVCAAITAAREGEKVVLIQDRPVLGGNASSEVRLWALGATSHMGNNNRWAREGGVIDEILVENTYRNKEGNSVIFDSVLLDKVLNENNIELLLDTAVCDIEKSSDHIDKVIAFNSQNSTRYEIAATLFCDSSGDGIVAYKAGASYRFGAEGKDEFGESFVPTEEYGELLGHSIMFYPKLTDKPVKFTAPDFALKDVSAIPKINSVKSSMWGCNYWWVEYGGKLNTVLDSEKIKMELWKVVYGIWDYIKNSGNFPEAENMTLEWVGKIPGKRESLRFNGLYMLTQKDVVEQTVFGDTVSFGGWAIDLHPADGVYSPLPSCNQYHSKGIYSIPYRCFVSKDVDNLFISGRLISASHVAFGSTRVMLTSAHGGQAVGMAAALCSQKGIRPEDLLNGDNIKQLQQNLDLAGQSIPFVSIEPSQLMKEAKVSASSSLSLEKIPQGTGWISLEYGAAQMLPLKQGVKYSFDINVSAEMETSLLVELAYAKKEFNYTPDTILESKEIDIKQGEQTIHLVFDKEIRRTQYIFLIFRPNPSVKLRSSDHRLTGVLSVFNKFNHAVNNYGKQMPPEGSGFEEFEFWCPERRPGGKNIAMKITPALDCFGPLNVFNGYIRPTVSPNAWVADPEDRSPELKIDFSHLRIVEEIIIYLDTDYDNPMETTQWGHFESVQPFCVRNLTVESSDGTTVLVVVDNHQTIIRKKLEIPIETSSLTIKVTHPSVETPATIFGVFIN